MVLATWPRLWKLLTGAGSTGGTTEEPADAATLPSFSFLRLLRQGLPELIDLPLLIR